MKVIKKVIRFCKRCFMPSKKLATNGKDHLEAQYWPEVKHFMDEIDKLVETHTIDDDNIRVVNQRILDYMVTQINAKGSIENIEQRYAALNTLADRILVNNLSKLVGVKKTDSTSADFTSAVDHFKEALEKRHELEVKSTEKH